MSQLARVIALECQVDRLTGSVNTLVEEVRALRLHNAQRASAESAGSFHLPCSSRSVSPTSAFHTPRSSGESSDSEIPHASDSMPHRFQTFQPHRHHDHSVPFELRVGSRRVRLSFPCPLQLEPYTRLYLVTHPAPGASAGVYVNYRSYGEAVQDRSVIWRGKGRIPFHPQGQSHRFDNYSSRMRHWLETFGAESPPPPLRF